MQNKIILHDVAVGADDVCSVFDNGDAQTFNNISKEHYRNIHNYASLDGAGIDLTDETMTLEDENSIHTGVISAHTLPYDYATNFVFLFGDDPISATAFTLKAVTIKFFRHKFSGEVWWGSFADRTEWTIDDIDDNMCVTVFPPNGTIDCSQIVLYFDTPEIASPNTFVKLAALDFGYDRELTEFNGAINVFEEIDPTCRDVPSANCDFSLITTDPPLECQELKLYCDDVLEDIFSVSKVTRDAVDVYMIEARGVSEKLDDLSPFSADVTYDGESPSEIAAALKEEYQQDCFISTLSTGIYGIVKANTTVRQDIAFISFATRHFIKTQGIGIPTLCQPKGKDGVIDASRILNKANKEFQGDYSAVAYEVNNDTYVAKNNDALDKYNLGILKVDNMPLIETDMESDSAVVCCQWVNENEVIATIYVEDEQVGDIVTLELPYGDGLFTGIIVSEQLSLTTAKTAEIKVRKMADAYALNSQ